MNVDSAIALIDNLLYLPGWGFEAADHTNRFEGSVKVKITYPARNSNRDQAPDGYPETITTYAEFPMVVANCDDMWLYRKVANAVVEIETHEMREFLRVKPTFWAPFHPHRIDGMKRWNATEDSGPADDIFPDLRFGIA
jgi:hypothetical protein